MLLTFYGVNNIGKTTHAKRLVDKLNREGVTSVYLKYPIYAVEPSGAYLNEQLRGAAGQTMPEEELQMWFVINRMQYAQELEKLIAKYDVVVAEDYIETGIAWGTAKGADEQWLETINKPLRQADLNLLMIGERDTTAIEAGHVHENDNSLIDKCAAVLARRAAMQDWLTVELQTEPDDTAALIWQTLVPHLPGLSNQD